MPNERTTIRRELLFSMGALFMAALLVALLAMLLTFPFASSPGATSGLLGVVLAADLVILFVFGGRLLDRLLLTPMDRVVQGAERIAAGEYDHRIAAEGTEEVDRLVRSVNRMAEHLIRDRKLLAENVRSLDATNRELVETTDQLVRTARLASVGTMASGIAHEVGNPLGALMGYLDVAERRSGDPRTAASALRSAREEADRIDRIVRSLLAFTRPGEGSQRTGPGIDLTQLVPRILDLLATQGVTSSLTVEWDPADALPRVEGEPQHLEQVLVNLLVNARDALSDRRGGAIWISARSQVREVPVVPPRRESDPSHVDFSHRRRDKDLGSRDRVARAGRVVYVEVEDNGPGISEDVLGRIFDPFVTSKQPGEGMGLGLAISARMVEEMGGRIEAENRPEGGARFRLLLPALPTRGKPRAQPSSARRPAPARDEAQ